MLLLLAGDVVKRSKSKKMKKRKHMLPYFPTIPCYICVTLRISSSDLINDQVHAHSLIW